MRDLMRDKRNERSDLQGVGKSVGKVWSEYADCKNASDQQLVRDVHTPVIALLNPPPPAEATSAASYSWISNERHRWGHTCSDHRNDAILLDVPLETSRSTSREDLLTIDSSMSAAAQHVHACHRIDKCPCQCFLLSPRWPRGSGLPMRSPECPSL